MYDPPASLSIGRWVALPLTLSPILAGGSGDEGSAVQNLAECQLQTEYRGSPSEITTSGSSPKYLELFITALPVSAPLASIHIFFCCPDILLNDARVCGVMPLSASGSLLCRSWETQPALEKAHPVGPSLHRVGSSHFGTLCLCRCDGLSLC
ncbi:hypothetical protein DPEC_G00369970 [Dallia pectoralis]|nr:hypothetical protein DPEC_G00369970 [Dallia pectoralis]